MKTTRRCAWIFLLGLGVGAPLCAQSDGFHYVPAGPASNHFLVKPRPGNLSLRMVSAAINDNVYRGGVGNNETWMVGLGGIYQRALDLNSFSAVIPQVGLVLLSGDPADYTGSSRRRYSLQAPLALYYTFQLYRDDRDPGEGGVRLGAHAGAVLPVVGDFTADGNAFSTDFGVQGGLTLGVPMGTQHQQLLEFTVAVAQFLVGYTRIDDIGNNYEDEVDGQPVDLAGQVVWVYRPWHLGLGADFHWTSSLGDRQGDSVVLVGLQVNLYTE